MATELKSKCYTCLDPNALVDLANCPSTDLACCSTLDHHRLFTIYSQSPIINTHNRDQTYMKQTKLQLGQYTNQ